MAESSAKNLLKLLEKSKLADPDRLKDSLSSLSEKAAGRRVRQDELVGHLIESGIITQWHADKLTAGKYKGFFLDKYKLLGHLGTGGMSSVYLAESKSTGQKRAIKVLPKKKVSDKSYLDRFYREGKAAASLSHPNVVRIYDISNSGDTHYMVMEYVKGSDLYEKVKDEGALGFDQAIDAIIQSATGLQHAHEREMVHRDIKPANLLMTDEGVVKILDLGLALFSEEGEESLTVLYNEKVMGTADYLSPEQAVNSHEVDHRADIYSLGCTLYFLIAGRPPFDKGTLAQRIAMHQTKEPDGIETIRPDTPRGIIDICTRMMKKKPEDRFADCGEIIAALKNYKKTGSGVIEHGSGKSAAASDSGSSLNAVDDPIASADKGSIKQQVASLSNVNFAAEEQQPVVHHNEFEVQAHQSIKGEPIPVASKPNAAPRIRRRKKKAIPKWIIPTLIASMLAILTALLVVVSKFSS